MAKNFILEETHVNKQNPNKPLGLSGFCYIDAVFMLQ